MSYTKDLIIGAVYIGFIVLLGTDSTLQFEKINALKLLNNKYFIDSAKHNEKKNCVYLYVKAVLKPFSEKGLPQNKEGSEGTLVPKIESSILKPIMETLVKELKYKSVYGKLYFTPAHEFKGQSQISINCGYTESNNGCCFKTEN